MRLLLTSAGITNDSIAKALTELLSEDVSDSNLAFVPTAANVETGGKVWLIDNLVQCKILGFRQIDIVDISALSKEQWLPRLEEADVLVFGGGCTPHLLNWLTKSGASSELRGLLDTRVYVGISAGSIAAGQEPIPELSDDPYAEDIGECLGLADLIFLPHLDSPSFPKAAEANIRSKTGELTNVYALDDQSALTVVDGDIRVVSEGKHIALRPLIGH